MTWTTFATLLVIYTIKSQNQSQESPQGNCLTLAAEETARKKSGLFRGKPYEERTWVHPSRSRDWEKKASRGQYLSHRARNVSSNYQPRSHPWKNTKYQKRSSLILSNNIKPEWYFLFAYAILRSIPNAPVSSTVSKQLSPKDSQRKDKFCFSKS